MHFFSKNSACDVAPLLRVNLDQAAPSGAPRDVAQPVLQPVYGLWALDVGRGTVDDESVMSPRQRQMAQDDKGAAACTERDVRISHSGTNALAVVYDRSAATMSA